MILCWEKKIWEFQSYNIYTGPAARLLSGQWHYGWGFLLWCRFLVSSLKNTALIFVDIFLISYLLFIALLFYSLFWKAFQIHVCNNYFYFTGILITFGLWKDYWWLFVARIKFGIVVVWNRWWNVFKQYRAISCGFCRQPFLQLLLEVNGLLIPNGTSLIL